MVIQLLGKQHMKGTSKKTGRDYDFISLHFLTNDNRVEGKACKVINVSSSVCSYDKLLVQQHYDVECDFDGNVVAIAPAKV